MHTQLQGQTDRPLPPPLLPSTCCSAALVPQARLQGHRHYVQGVAWDPLGAWMISQSADRYTHSNGSGLCSRLVATPGQQPIGTLQPI